MKNFKLSAVIEKDKDEGREIKPNVKRDSVKSMRGILKNVKETSVELQHELGKIWAEEASCR